MLEFVICDKILSYGNHEPRMLTFKGNMMTESHGPSQLNMVRLCGVNPWEANVLCTATLLIPEWAALRRKWTVCNNVDLLFKTSNAEDKTITFIYIILGKKLYRGYIFSSFHFLKRMFQPADVGFHCSLPCVHWITWT